MSSLVFGCACGAWGASASAIAPVFVSSGISPSP
jgi:hypothetical protein